MSALLDYSGLTFLVADDSRFMRRLVVSSLRAFGARIIHEASTGEEAYAAMRQTPCDIVILDWEFPDRSGESIMKEIRNPDHPLAYQTIIMMSGHDEMRRIKRALRFGVNGYVAKPVAPKTLYAQIVQAIVKPRPFLRSPHYFGPQHPLLIADIQRKEEAEQERLKVAQPAALARSVPEVADVDDFALI